MQRFRVPQGEQSVNDTEATGSGAALHAGSSGRVYAHVHSHVDVGRVALAVMADIQIFFRLYFYRFSVSCCHLTSRAFIRCPSTTLAPPLPGSPLPSLARWRSLRQSLRGAAPRRYVQKAAETSRSRRRRTRISSCWSHSLRAVAPTQRSGALTLMMLELSHPRATSLHT